MEMNIPTDPTLPTGSPDEVAPPPMRGRSQTLLEEASSSVGWGTTIMILSTIALFAFNLVARIVIARTLSVSVWGEFNLGVAFTSLLSVVILLGLNQAVARSLAYEADGTERRAIVQWSLIVSGAVSVAASIVTFVFAVPLAAPFHDPGLVGVFQLLAISVGFGAITPVYAAVFQGFHNVWPNALFNQIVNPVLLLVFVLILLPLGFGLTGALVAYVIADAVGYVGIVVYYYARIGKYLPGRAKLGRLPNPRLWVLGGALWGVASLAFVTAFADTLILGLYWPATTVGYYSTAMTLARVVLLGGSALTYVFLPVASRFAREKEYRALGVTYVTAARWILVLSVPLLLLFALLPNLSIVALFGKKYLPAAFPLQFLVITAFVSVALGPVNATLAGLGRARNQAVTALVAGVTNVALSFALIPKYGVLGAAIAWGFARALYPALGFVLLVRDYGIHPFRPILTRPLALTLGVGIPMFLAVRFLGPPSWVVFPLFFVASGLFVASLLVTRSLSRGDLILVETLERTTRRPLPRIRAFLERYISPNDPAKLLELKAPEG